MDTKEQKQEEQKSPWEESGPVHQKGNLDQIEKLIEQNLRMTEEIYKMTKKIKGYISFQKVVSFIYLLLIVVPIVLGVIYLPPLLGNVFNQYQDLLGAGQNSTGGEINNDSQFDLGDIDLNQLSPELRKLLGQ